MALFDTDSDTDSDTDLPYDSAQVHGLEARVTDWVFFIFLTAESKASRISNDK